MRYENHLGIEVSTPRLGDILSVSVVRFLCVQLKGTLYCCYVGRPSISPKLRQHIDYLNISNKGVCFCSTGNSLDESAALHINQQANEDHIGAEKSSGIKEKETRESKHKRNEGHLKV